VLVAYRLCLGERSFLLTVFGNRLLERGTRSGGAIWLHPKPYYLNQLSVTESSGRLPQLFCQQSCILVQAAFGSCMPVLMVSREVIYLQVPAVKLLELAAKVRI
jgi:hypothetical protein